MPSLIAGDARKMVPALFLSGFSQGRQQAYNNMLNRENQRIQANQVKVQRDALKWQKMTDVLKMAGTTGAFLASSPLGASAMESVGNIFKRSPSVTPGVGGETYYPHATMAGTVPPGFGPPPVSTPGSPKLGPGVYDPDDPFDYNPWG